MVMGFDSMKNAVQEGITPDSVVHGRKTFLAPGAAVSIGDSTTLKQGVNVKTTTGTVYLGGVGVDDTDGYALASTDAPIFIPCDNLADILGRALASNASISFIGG